MRSRMEKEITELSEEIGQLAKIEKKQASVWWTFLRAAMYGLGFFIGSAVLAAVVLIILSRFQRFGNLGDIVDQIMKITGKAKP